MRPLSAPIRLLIDQLRAHAGPGAGGGGGTPYRAGAAEHGILSAIDDLARHARPEVALELSRWALSEHRAVACAALEAADRVVRALDDDAIVWLERGGRALSPYHDPRAAAWAALRPADLERVVGSGPAAASLLCLLSQHASGYLRQACVERLAALRDGVELPFLLLRMNDWVSPVRAAARAAVLARVAEARAGDQTRARQFLAHLPLVDRLESWGRADHRPVCAAIRALALSAAAWPAVEAALSSPDAATRRRCFRIALDHPGRAPAEILARALRDRDVALRRWAAIEAVARLRGDDLRRAAALMRHDQNASVRNQAVFALAAKISPPVREELERALLDPSPTVRWTARYHLQRDHHLDIRAFYLRALREPRGGDPARLAAAVAGLSECGNPEDAAVALPLCAHPEAAVRAAAVYALGKLGGDARTPELVAALRDPRASVAREAARQLGGRVARVGEAALAALLRGEAPPHARRMALRLALELDPYMALGLLIEGAGAAEAEVAAEARAQIQRWLGKSRPGAPRSAAATLDRLDEARLAARQALGDPLCAALGQALAALRRPR